MSEEFTACDQRVCNCPKVFIDDGYFKIIDDFGSVYGARLTEFDLERLIRIAEYTDISVDDNTVSMCKFTKHGHTLFMTEVQLDMVLIELKDHLGDNKNSEVE